MNGGRFMLIIDVDPPSTSVLEVMPQCPQLGEPAKKYWPEAGDDDLLTESVGQLLEPDGSKWRIIYQYGQPRTDGKLSLVPEFAGAVG